MEMLSRLKKTMILPGLNRWIKRRWLTGLLVLLSISPFLTYSQCDTLKTLDQDLADANVVILGEVVDVATNWVSGGLKVTFAVEKSWKRSIEKYTTVNTGTLAQGGFSFEKGQSYLVFIHKKFNLKVDRCSRAGPIAQMSAEIKALGEGFSTGNSPGATRVKWAFVILSLGSLLFVAWVVLRKKFRKQID